MAQATVAFCLPWGPKAVSLEGFSESRGLTFVPVPAEFATLERFLFRCCLKNVSGNADETPVPVTIIHSFDWNAGRRDLEEAFERYKKASSLSCSVPEVESRAAEIVSAIKSGGTFDVSESHQLANNPSAASVLRNVLLELSRTVLKRSSVFKLWSSLVVSERLEDFLTCFTSWDQLRRPLRLGAHVLVSPLCARLMSLRADLHKAAVKSFKVHNAMASLLGVNWSLEVPEDLDRQLLEARKRQVLVFDAPLFRISRLLRIVSVKPLESGDQAALGLDCCLTALSHIDSETWVAPDWTPHGANCCRALSKGETGYNWTKHLKSVTPDIVVVSELSELVTLLDAAETPTPEVEVAVVSGAPSVPCTQLTQGAPAGDRMDLAGQQVLVSILTGGLVLEARTWLELLGHAGGANVPWESLKEASLVSLTATQEGVRVELASEVKRKLAERTNRIWVGTEDQLKAAGPSGSPWHVVVIPRDCLELWEAASLLRLLVDGGMGMREISRRLDRISQLVCIAGSEGNPFEGNKAWKSVAEVRAVRSSMGWEAAAEKLIPKGANATILSEIISSFQRGLQVLPASFGSIWEPLRSASRLEHRSLDVRLSFAEPSWVERGRAETKLINNGEFSQLLPDAEQLTALLLSGEELPQGLTLFKFLFSLLAPVEGPVPVSWSLAVRQASCQRESDYLSVAREGIPADARFVDNDRIDDQFYFSYYQRHLWRADIQSS